ncbi:MAG TPA: cobalamin-binding protein [Nitrososphaeraceae archaeon]|nr:cobalamin-binding protein [Nitrososphaeraceae archaeon]
MSSVKKRIVSFLPSSTEILYEINAGSQIVGVTHECKYPEDAKRKPRVINASFDANKMTSNEIDQKITELMQSGGDIYVIDDEKLRQARPDLVIAQGICEVCAPFTKEIDRAFSILGYKPDILMLDPHNIDGILISIMHIAKRVDRVIEGRRLVVSLQKRIDTVRMRSRPGIGNDNNNENNNDAVSRKINDDKPKVLCLEWINPFFTAGHWVPEMVEIAGGINGLSYSGQASRRVNDIDDIERFNADKIILMPCGFDIERTLQEAKILETNDKWKSLQSVQNNEVYVVNAGAYFSKPGPRTITGLEVIAKIIDPEGYKDIQVPDDSFRKYDYY